MSSDLFKIGFDQPFKWADFRLDALLADTMLTSMLTKLYTIGPKSNNMYYEIKCSIFYELSV
jgi:hypothetical protein